MIQVNEYVKQALRDGRFLKNYRFNVLDQDGNTLFEINNNNLIRESVNIEENLCSESNLKFGLCEASSLTFTYFGLSDITGTRVQAFVDVQYLDADNVLQWQEIPLGFFDVKNCARQASTGQIKVTAYNKLKSDYLDAEIEIKSVTSDLIDATKVTPYKIKKDLLNGYQMPEEKENAGSVIVVPSGVEWTASLGVNVTIGGQSKALMARGTASTVVIRNTERIVISNDTTDKFVAAGEVLKQNFFTVVDNANSVWDLVASALFDHFGAVVSWYGTDANYSVYPTSHAVRGQIKDLNTIGDNPLQVLFYNDIELYVSGQTVASAGVNYNQIVIKSVDISAIDNSIIPITDKTITLRDLASSVFEINCQFGQLSRITDLFEGIELNKGGLYPRIGLYPHTGLYPSGAVAVSNKAAYSSLFTNIQGADKFRNLLIKYKGLDADGNETDFEFTKEIDPDGTVDYLMDNNWILNNLTWTAAQIGQMADAMATKMFGITWFPYEMDGPGLPYLETGDLIEITTDLGSFHSYILERQLKGIQNLQDSYYCGTVNTF